MAALVGVLVVPATRGAADPPAENVVVEWNETAWAALTASSPALLVHVLHQAMVHGAVYDAVNAIDGSYEPYLGSPSAQPWYSKEAAAATAAYFRRRETRASWLPGPVVATCFLNILWREWEKEGAKKTGTDRTRPCCACVGCSGSPRTPPSWWEDSVTATRSFPTPPRSIVTSGNRSCGCFWRRA
jgi:hypothetical protein